MNNKGSIYTHLVLVSVYLLIPLLLLCIVCPGNEFTTCYQNVSIGLFTSSSDFPSEWNDRECVVNHVVCWEQYICPTPASVLFHHGHYTSMIVGVKCTRLEHGLCVPCSNEIVRVKCTPLEHGLCVPCSNEFVGVKCTRLQYGIWLPCAQN